MLIGEPLLACHAMAEPVALAPSQAGNSQTDPERPDCGTQDRDVQGGGLSTSYSSLTRDYSYNKQSPKQSSKNRHPPRL